MNMSSALLASLVVFLLNPKSAKKDIPGIFAASCAVASMGHLFLAIAATSLCFLLPKDLPVLIGWVIVGIYYFAYYLVAAIVLQRSIKENS